MIKVTNASRLSGRRLVLAAGGLALAAVGAGWIVATDGWVVGLVILASLVLVALAFVGPEGMLVLLVCAGPFMVGRMVDLGPGTPDISLERVLLLWAACVLVVQWLTRRRSLPVLGVEDGLLLAFLAWGLVSIFLWKPGNVAQQLLDFGTYLLPLVAYLVVKSTANRERALFALIVPAVPLLLIISLVVPGEWISGMSILGVDSQPVAGTVRSQSFFRSPWEFGTVAGMLMGLCLFSLGTYVARPLRRLTALAIGVGAVAISLSFMRAAWLGMLTVVGILAWQNRKLRGLVFLGLLVLVLLGVAYSAVLVQSHLWTDRIAHTGNVIGRMLLLQQQWSLFLRNPVFGIGLGGLASTTFEFSRDFATISHNMYMSHLIDFGLLGLTYLAAIFMILAKSVDTYRRLPRGKPVGKELVAALWAAVAVFLIAAATLETRLFMYVNVLLWVALGLLAAVRARVVVDRSE